MNTLRSFRLAASGVALCAGLSIAMTTVHAGPIDEPPSMTVNFSDLDLSKPVGAKILYQRIQQAARIVCERLLKSVLATAKATSFISSMENPARRSISRAARAPDGKRTYGYHRVRVLAALANGATLLLLVAWIVWEAIARLREPVEVLAGPMLIVAIIGLLINIAGALILNSGNKGDSNLRGALLHVMGDLLGSVGAIAAAIGIMLTGWTVLDPILSVVVALLVVRSAWRLIADSIQVLLQATPSGIDADRAEAELKALPGIADAGHFHAWTLTDDASVATVHVTPAPGADSLTLPAVVGGFLRERYGLSHVTVQVDPPGSLERHS